MKVISYLNVIPKKNKSQEKIDLLYKFVKGVSRNGDTGVVSTSNCLENCDVAVIQGWQHEKGKTSPHLRLRGDIIKGQASNQKHVCTADANLFLYATEKNTPHHYLRYSLDGVFPSTGIYFDNDIDPQRWNQISRDLNISIEDYKTSGSIILLCLQRDAGWSMGQESVFSWTVNTVNELRRYTNRNIKIRCHPKDNKSFTYINKLKSVYANDKSIQFSKTNVPIEEDLKNTWAVINKNSSSIVGPIIKGYYSFVTDPASSQCAEVSNHSLSQIEKPLIFDRTKWLERISMCHWKFSELEDGSAWAHIKGYV
jgi:hypothetical protein